jgi:hypothetical protein
MRYHEAMARRSITIELEEDEYRRLEDEAARYKADLSTMAHDALMAQLSGVQMPAPDASWHRFLEAAEELRRHVKPWAPGEFKQFLSELREERDARP